MKQHRYRTQFRAPALASLRRPVLGPSTRHRQLICTAPRAHDYTPARRLICDEGGKGGAGQSTAYHAPTAPALPACGGRTPAVGAPRRRVGAETHRTGRSPSPPPPPRAPPLSQAQPQHRQPQAQRPQQHHRRRRRLRRRPAWRPSWPCPPRGPQSGPCPRANSEAWSASLSPTTHPRCRGWSSQPAGAAGGADERTHAPGPRRCSPGAALAGRRRSGNSPQRQGWRCRRAERAGMQRRASWSAEARTVHVSRGGLSGSPCGTLPVASTQPLARPAR